MRRKIAALGMLCLALLLFAFGGTLYPTHAQVEFPFRLALPYIVRNAIIGPPTLPPEPPPPTPEPVTPTLEPSEPRTIEVIARAYEFVPGTIEVRVGEEVRFVVSSPDMYHTFTVKRSQDAQETLIHLDVFPSAPAEVTHTFTDLGDNYLYCVPHEILGMTGVIRVTE